VCLVVVAFAVQPEYPLVVAANRDEFHARPTQNADWWPDQPDIVAGRDLQAGGTWLGLHRAGRFATITNFRDANSSGVRLRSRGHLVTEFLLSERSPLDYLTSISPDEYAGFNLLVADGERLAYLSNRGGSVRELPPGVYGLSNATLDTPWEKVERSKSRLGEILANGDANDTQLFRLLDDREKGPVSEVKSDRLPFETAHAITAPFIVTPEYGTRCSSIVRADKGGRWQLLERRFNSAGKNTGEAQFSFHSGEDRQ
jgi:uncharacterized protein with NRDE domain